MVKVSAFQLLCSATYNHMGFGELLISTWLRLLTEEGANDTSLKVEGVCQD